MQREDVVYRVAEALRSRGFDVETAPTVAKGSAQAQARSAVQGGVQAVFACGGDGTIHDVLQGVAGSGALLGIVPAGSANVLAKELSISANPIEAARSYFPTSLRHVRLSALTRGDNLPHYFLCMAGAGPAGALMYQMMTVERGRLGRLRYYEHALRSFLSQRFRPFQVQVTTSQGDIVRKKVVSAMALRVGDLGGVFRGIAKGAKLDDSLHVVLVAAPAELTLPLWFLTSWFGIQGLHPGVTSFYARELVCFEIGTHLQVDGEWLGRAPAVFEMSPLTQAMLVPSRQ